MKTYRVLVSAAAAVLLSACAFESTDESEEARVDEADTNTTEQALVPLDEGEGDPGQNGCACLTLECCLKPGCGGGPTCKSIFDNLPIGRPLVIDGVARVADVELNDDWA